MGQVDDIISGWSNYLKGDEKSLQMAKDRLKICVECTDGKGEPNMIDSTFAQFIPDKPLKMVQGKKCKQCGCPASGLLRSETKKCPLGKW